MKDEDLSSALIAWNLGVRKSEATVTGAPAASSRPEALSISPTPGLFTPCFVSPESALEQAVLRALARLEQAVLRGARLSTNAWKAGPFAPVKASMLASERKS